MKILRNICFIILSISVIVLPSCTAGGTVISVGNTSVDNEIFTYFLNSAIDCEGSKKSSDIILSAAESVRYYVKVNTSAAKHKLTLSGTQKKELSGRLADVWAVYGEYYKKIGVSKETVGKVLLSEEYETAFLTYYYSEGAEKAVDSSELLNCFNRNFCVFKAVTGNFIETGKDGAKTSLSDIQKEVLVSDFKNAAKQINNGELTLDSAASKLDKNYSGVSPETIMIKKGTPFYTSEFFDRLAEAKGDSASVIETQDNVYLVYKENITAESAFFTDSYMAALKILKGDELKSAISSENSYEMKLSQNSANILYNQIIKTKEESK